MLDVDSSMETRKSMRDIKLVCDVEMQGSTTLSDLHLLVSYMQYVKFIITILSFFSA